MDPQGVIFTQSWTWLNRKLWPKENVKAFLDAFPEGDVMVWEIWNDNAGGHPMYKEMDYYFGKPWLMGFLYSYGGQTNLHGDLAGLVKRVREVATEPKAKKCLGIAVQPEAMHHNHVFFDILSRLGWNPMGVELGSFLEEYAFRRYGKESAPKMVRFLKELAASVYGSDDTYPSLYHLRIYEIRAPPPPSGLQSIWKGAYGVSLSQRSKFIPHLQRALEIALEEAGRLGECPLFQHDLIDVGRQFLADLFNLRLAWLYEAFKSGDKKTFGKEAHILDEVLQSLEMLLSSNDYFCLQPILDKAMALPDVPKDFDQRVRDILTIWDGKILDYARRDYYELVRFYYRKRVNAFINYLEEKIAKGSNEIRDDELSPLYHEIEQSWVRKPFRVKKSEKYAGTTAEAAEEIIKKHGLTKEELRTIKVLK
ncbi:MAG: alpha-N-acetylglucosaminidase C-terminal domain-containing protein [Thermoproteota archaeon]